MNCFFILLFLCVHVSLIAIRPTHLFVDTTRHTALLPIDPQYENAVLHACLLGDSVRASSLLQDKERRIFSDHFFKDVQRALQASYPCRPNTMCIMSSSLSGFLAALFTQAIIPAQCPCSTVLIPASGCVIGFMPAGVANVVSYSQEHQELLNAVRADARRESKAIGVQHQPPPQLSMHTSQCQATESQ